MTIKLFAQKQNQPKVENKKSIFTKLFSIFVSILFVVIVIYSFNLQVFSSTTYSLKSSLLKVDESDIAPLRGLFYDANNVLLTKNVQKYDLYLRKEDYTDANLDNLTQIVASNLSRNKGDLKKVFNQIKINKYDLKVLTNLSSSDAYKLQNNLKDASNYLYFESNFKREYIYPEPFSHIIGYVTSATADDLKNGYSVNDQVGRYKLESQLEDQLKGTKGKSIYVDGVETKEESEAGDNVFLTIDSKWQTALYNILGSEIEYFGAAGGAGVIVDDSNGNVVSMVSYPGFDSNLFINGISSDKYNSYLTIREKPLLDKAIGLQAAPGSIFKIITSYSLLQNNIIDENTTYFSNGCLNYKNFDFCEYHKLAYGRENIVKALYKSSNLFFCNNMLNMYEQNKIDKFVDAAKLFNIGEKTGINLVGEIAGNMDSPEYRKDVYHTTWYEGDTCNAAIGQGAIVTTPIQMAMVASIIQNNGVYYQPNIISKITDQFGNIIEQPKPIIKRTIPIEQKTLDLINQGMYDVANYPAGTVYFYLHGLPGNIRAKTGTAEAYENVNGQEVYRTHGWIVGTFDYNNKHYSYSFHMNYGGGGFYIARSLKKFVTCLYSDFAKGCENR